MQQINPGAIAAHRSIEKRAVVFVGANFIDTNMAFDLAGMARRLARISFLIV